VDSRSKHTWEVWIIVASIVLMVTTLIFASLTAPVAGVPSKGNYNFPFVTRTIVTTVMPEDLDRWTE